MKKKNGGFTLIELMIAVAVLSIMAGVLFQAFVVSRKMNAKARKEEVLLDAAKQTMEELKGYSFEKLDGLSVKNKNGTVLIRGTEYEYGPLGAASGEDEESGGPAGKSAGPSGNNEGPADQNGGPADQSEGPSEKSEGPSGKSAGSSGESGDGSEADGEEEYEPGNRRKAKADDEDETKDGYRLVKGYGRDPSGKGPAYLICAEVDRGLYSQEEDSDDMTSRSINRYQMPNIVDVSSFQNVVVDPQVLSRDDELLTAELLMKVNQEEDNEDEDGGGTGEASEQKDTGSGEEADDDTVDEFDESDVKRYLKITVHETEGSQGSGTEDEEDMVKGGSLQVTVQTVYTVKPLAADGKPDDGYSITADLASFKKRVVREEKGKLPANRIYLFLPDKGTLYFEQIFVEAKLEESIEFYAVAASPDDYKFAVGDPIEIKKTGDAELSLYSNIGDTGLVSLDDARNRLYLLTVTVYEADYSEAGSEPDAKPAMGREVLRLDSTKAE